MQLQLQDFTTLIRNMAASVQASARALIDLTTGSVLRAILEANASIALWMQWLIVLVLAQTRAATSNGTDLDSWVADFSLSRLPGQPAATTAVFSRVTPGLATNIPVGTQVKTVDGAVRFAVLGDPFNPCFDPVANSYVLAANASSIGLSIQTVVPGALGNVQAGTITLLASAIPGVDAVTNPVQAAGGTDPEPDDALRARFTNFIDSRSRATPAAIAFAIDSLQQGLQHVVTENVDPAGNVRPGFFTVTADDGSGTPPASLIAAIAAAIDGVRPVGTMFAVHPPTIVRANISMSLTVAMISRQAAQAAVAEAVSSYITSLPIGAPLSVSRLAAIGYGASGAVTNISAVSINGAGDLVPPPTGIVKAGSVAVN